MEHIGRIKWQAPYRRILDGHRTTWMATPPELGPANVSARALPSVDLSRSLIRPAYMSGPSQVALWGGWEATPGSADSNQPFDGAAGGFTVPSVVAGSTHTVSIWVGLGCCNAPDTQLIQTGVDISNKCTFKVCNGNYTASTTYPVTC